MGILEGDFPPRISTRLFAAAIPAFSELKKLAQRKGVRSASLLEEKSGAKTVLGESPWSFFPSFTTFISFPCLSLSLSVAKTN